MFLIFSLFVPIFANDYPWTYDNDVMGGPNFWGLMLGKENEMCSKGKLQSPIDIQPEKLLFDPSIKSIHMDKISMFLIFSLFVPIFANDYPWTYDNDVMGGPNFWGLMLGKENEMCSKGKLQSPIDIQPEKLLFDPSIKSIHMDKISVTSELVNTGQMPRVRIGNSARRPSANLTAGPLQYRYQVQRIDIHFGRELLNGSEHTIDGRRFPMEIQILAYNTDLYSNFSHAGRSPHGLAAVAILVDFGADTNEELLKLTVASASVLNKGKRVELADLQPWKLLPHTRDYVTYDGSMTSPGCHETVTWIIVNQPIHITKDHWSEWGKMLQTVENSTPKSDAEPQFIGPNVRSVQEFHKRLMRTNIQHKLKPRQECKMAVPKVQYRINRPVEPAYLPPETQNTTAKPKHNRRHTHHNNHGEWDLL